jgi:hypothetical protein
VIEVPPELAGAVKVTETLVFPVVAVPMVGAPGTVTGVTVLDAADDELVPTLLVAVMVKL